jgi:hypothetical protein
VFFLNLAVGIIFVMIWGILVHLASDGTEFKSLFLGGLANFVFFVGGLVAAYFSKFLPGGTVSSSMAPVSPARSGLSSFSIPIMIYVAVATTGAVLVLNFFCNVFTNSLDRMEALNSLSTTPEGYRDAQLYVGALIGTLCFCSALTSGLFAGALYPGATFLSVVSGVAISLGMQGGLYWLFGIFLGYQVSQVFTISTPAVLGTYGPVVRRIVGSGITGISIAFLAIFWSILFWLSIKVGTLIRSLPIFR